MPLDRSPSAPLALWGGFECSHVLVRGDVRDQFMEAGHGAREGDLDRVAALGLRVLRYPLLWATVAKSDGRLDFSWHDRRFAQMRALGITPIAGLMHHGSGPGGLDPARPEFTAGLADYAEAVAMRFPWVEHYTPINEPVTTARFAYLYGHWHPHARDEAHFLRAVVGSAAATAEAMRRIRRHNPAAKLVQTEDLGRTFSEPTLAYQAEDENERRFLGFDLLTGRVDRTHFFYRSLIKAGVPARDLDRLVDDPCPPDIVGIDYYLSSDRFLDSRLDLHPNEEVGGNEHHRYVDVPAARMKELEPELGHLALIRETFSRYGLPIAVTEVHNGCTREEQLRWLMEAWEAGLIARAEGVPIHAITVWSLFGTLDWNSLLTARQGHYESGAFDTRVDPPRPTAIAHAARALVETGDYHHPLLEERGWWRRAAEPTMAERAPVLHVAGSPMDMQLFEHCCRRRRIPISLSPNFGSRLAWGEIRIDASAGRRRFRYRGLGDRVGDMLEVEVSADADFRLAADAALDLIIDGETGRLRIEDLGPSHQYVATKLSDGVTPQPSVTPILAEAPPSSRQEAPRRAVRAARK